MHTQDAGHGYAQNLTASDELVWSWFVASFEGTPWPPPALAAASEVVQLLRHREPLQRRSAGEPATQPQQHLRETLAAVPVPRPPWPTARFSRRGGVLVEPDLKRAPF